MARRYTARRDIETNMVEDEKTEALKTIALMPLPVFTIEGQKYVRLETAKAMRQAARDALPPRDYSKL